MSKKTNQQTVIAMIFIVISLLFGVALFISLQDIHPKQKVKVISVEHKSLD